MVNKATVADTWREWACGVKCRAVYSATFEGFSQHMPFCQDPIPPKRMPNPIRTFDTGATRDTDQGKLEYRRFLSMPAVKRYCEYMREHRKQSDGQLRDPDNWKKGIPLNVYADSLYRHVQEFAQQLELPSGAVHELAAVEETLCAIIFNAMGYLHELRK